MTYGRFDQEQEDALRAIVNGRVVHDLGCGYQVLSETLLDLGATEVIGVDCLPHGRPVRSGITTVLAYFSEYASRNPTIDIAFVSWPLNRADHGLMELITRARMVVYLGKCTDGLVCGWPGLFRHFLSRELVAHVPHTTNTLCVYGAPALTPRTGELEERAGVDLETIYPYPR